MRASGRYDVAFGYKNSFNYRFEVPFFLAQEILRKSG